MSCPKYTIIIDSREQQPWEFRASTRCAGTVVEKLDEGDYSLRGCESVFRIERKASTAEIAMNLNEKRFLRVLERLDNIQHAFVVCEFTLADLLAFPANSGIPRSKWRHLRVTAPFLLRRIQELELNYRARWVFAGEQARDYAMGLFKRIMECTNNDASKN